MRSSRPGLAAALIFCCQANADPFLLSIPSGEQPPTVVQTRPGPLGDPEDTSGLAAGTASEPGPHVAPDDIPLEPALPTVDDESSTSPVVRHRQADLPVGPPLPGTEFFVTFPDGGTASSLAARATEAAGVPVTVVRKLSGNRAVIGIDRERLAAQVEEALGAIGLAVERVEPAAPTVMGRKPPPRFRLTDIDHLGSSALADALRRVLRERAWERRPPLYDAAASQLLKQTRVPLSLHEGDLPGSIILSPAPQGLAALLEEGIAATPGATGEPVAIARPYARGNRRPPPSTPRQPPPVIRWERSP